MVCTFYSGLSHHHQRWPTGPTLSSTSLDDHSLLDCPGGGPKRPFHSPNKSLPQVWLAKKRVVQGRCPRDQLESTVPLLLGRCGYNSLSLVGQPGDWRVSIRVFNTESVLYIKWPKYWSFSISHSNEYSGY